MSNGGRTGSRKYLILVVFFSKCLNKYEPKKFVGKEEGVVLVTTSPLVCAHISSLHKYNYKYAYRLSCSAPVIVIYASVQEHL